MCRCCRVSLEPIESRLLVYTSTMRTSDNTLVPGKCWQYRLEFVCIMMQRLHCNVFMLSYRGYGASDGYPSQHGITKDAQAALDRLCNRSDVDTSRIVIFGRSLGGAVGSVLAWNNPDKVSSLILENTFTSILDMAGIMLPFLKWFMRGRDQKAQKFLIFLCGHHGAQLMSLGRSSNPFYFCLD